VLTKIVNKQTWVVIFFLRGGFLTTPESVGSMAQRDNRHFLWYLACTFSSAEVSTHRQTQQVQWHSSVSRRLDLHHPAAGPPGRCPVQPSTPLGPDQVNALLLFSLSRSPKFSRTCMAQTQRSLRKYQVANGPQLGKIPDAVRM
jgi:hypothetical protein